MTRARCIHAVKVGMGMVAQKKAEGYRLLAVGEAGIGNTTTSAAVASVPAGKRVAFVIHGGCIMAIMERFAMPRREFYAYHIGNGEWITCRWDGGQIYV